MDVRRKQIHKEASSFLNPNFSKLTSSDLKSIFNLYDQSFGNEITNILKTTNSTVDFEVSNLGGERYAGKCKRNGCVYTLRFPIKMFVKLFNADQKSKFLMANGLKCYDRLECLLLTFEHELVHLLINLYGNEFGYSKSSDPLYAPHGKLFKCIVKKLFGHLDIRHELDPTLPDSESALTKKDFHVGDQVKIKAANKTWEGRIIKLNPKKAQIYISGGQILNANYKILIKS